MASASDAPRRRAATAEKRRGDGPRGELDPDRRRPRHGAAAGDALAFFARRRWLPTMPCIDALDRRRVEEHRFRVRGLGPTPDPRRDLFLRNALNKTGFASEKSVTAPEAVVIGITKRAYSWAGVFKANGATSFATARKRPAG